MQLRKVFLWSMVASLALDALLGIGALMFPRYGTEEEILGSAAIFAAFSLVALLCAIVLDKRRLVVLMWAGIGCSAAALVIWLALIWFDRWLSWGAEDVLGRAGSTFTNAAIVIAQSGLLGLVTLDRPWSRAVRVGTVTASVMLGTCIALLVWTWEFTDAFIDEDDLIRVLGVLLILSLCGTVVTPILWKVQAVRRAAPAESIPARVKVSLTCPRCGHQQALAAGRAACGRCGLRIEVNVQEPRCECGYLLHTLQGDRCPECGRAIPAADRWVGAG